MWQRSGVRNHLRHLSAIRPLTTLWALGDYLRDDSARSFMRVQIEGTIMVPTKRCGFPVPELGLGYLPLIAHRIQARSLRNLHRPVTPRRLR
jgi:hypothetical protein